MRKARYFVFEPFRLDAIDERLWEREKSVRLGRKALAVLERLVSMPGQLVTKNDLLATAWPDTSVCEAVLTTAMRELRRALGDQARVPRFIETVHGRGYRFIAPVIETNFPAMLAKSTPTPAAENGALAPLSRSRGASSHRLARLLVGREAELAQLREWHEMSQQGTRQIGFVAGEAGIGKTALVEAFVSEIAAQGKAMVARGQCVQQYGAGEAYMPILEALGRLARDGALPIVDILRQYAPSWLWHLPTFAAGQAPEAAPQAPSSVTPERMLRELADALEILTARDVLILILEDLHWSDTATLDWLAYIARRRDPARLLIVGAYRPVEVLLNKHPLRNLIAELRPHPQCPELVLDYLSGESVQDYVLLRCGHEPGLKELAETLHRRTGGHPLFLTTIVDELMRRRILEPANANGFAGADPQAIAKVIPSSVRQFIEHRFEQLPDEEQIILEAASVAGNPFSVAAVAAATSLPEEMIEARCVSWMREGQFLASGEAAMWPDGSLAARYGFRHDLFQEVVYARISPERRASLHQRIGGRLESAFGNRAATIAAELAMRFDQGRDPRRAVTYLEKAARNALQRSAYSEAGRHLTRAQELLEALPEGRRRLRQELSLSLLLGQVLMTTRGWGIEEVEPIYNRARELCDELRDTPNHLQVMWGLIAGSVVRARHHETQALAREALRLAKRQRDPVFQIMAHMELGGSTFMLGDSASARRHFREADILYDPRQHPSHLACFGVDMGMFSRLWATHAMWIEGYPDQALVRAEDTLGRARHLSHPFTQTVALAYVAMLNQFRRDVEDVARLAQATITHSTQHGFTYYLAWAEVLEGWSLAIKGAHEEGITEIHRGIGALQSMAGMRLSYYRALLAEACGRASRIDEALQAITDAFADIGKTEERCWEAELLRLRGELLLSKAMNQGAEAEGCFHKAIEVARGQQAKSLELRAAMSLSRLWRDEGKRRQARQLLAEVYGWFTEGFETRDLRDARALMEELES